MTSFEITAGIASIVGCLLSLGALIQAGRARAAAKQARDGIVLRTLADEFELAGERMDQLLDFIAQDRLAEAALRATELASALSELPYRRSPHLSVDSINELLNKQTQVQHIAERILMSRGQLLPPDEKERLVRICQDCRATLGKNLGIIKGKIDSGAMR